MKQTNRFMWTFTVLLSIIAGILLSDFIKPEPEPPKIVLNDWYWLQEGKIQVYRKGYLELPREARDSIRLDAINSIEQ